MEITREIASDRGSNAIMDGNALPVASEVPGSKTSKGPHNHHHPQQHARQLQHQEGRKVCEQRQPRAALPSATDAP